MDMNSRSLPPFVIDAEKPDQILDELAKVIDRHGAEFAIKKVVLYTPEMKKQKRDGSMHIEAAREKRLFTSEAGHFHGTQHNLKNNLTISALFGTLVLSASPGKEEQAFHMTFMPSQHDPRAPLPTTQQPAVSIIDTAHASRSADDFLKALEAHLPRQAVAERALPDLTSYIGPFGDLFDKLNLMPSTPDRKPGQGKGFTAAPA